MRNAFAALTLMLLAVLLPFAPASAETAPTPVPMTITVSGLEGDDEAVLRIGTDDGSLQLNGPPLYEHTVTGASETVQVSLELQDGGYLLVVEAPDRYFREPRGYLFRVYQGAIVNPGGHQIAFALIPPSARNYEPYRGPTAVPSFSPVVPPPPTTGVTYRAESVVGLSAPPKAPIQVAVPPPSIERIPSSARFIIASVAVVLLAAAGALVVVLRRKAKTR